MIDAPEIRPPGSSVPLEVANEGANAVANAKPTAVHEQINHPLEYKLFIAWCDL